MPPKIKTHLAPEPMAATQPDSPEMPDTPSVTESEKPPKKKKKSANTKGKTKHKRREGRPSKVTLVKQAIAKKMLVHEKKVQQFLDALDEVAVEFLETKGVLRLHFVTIRLRTTPAREATQKLVCGKTVTLKARPARRSVKLTAAKCLKQLCK